MADGNHQHQRGNEGVPTVALNRLGADAGKTPTPRSHDEDETPCECCGAVGTRWAGAYDNTFCCEPCAQEEDLAQDARNNRAMRYSR